MLIRGHNIYLNIATEEDAEYIKWLWADEKTMAEVGGPVEIDRSRILEWLDEEYSTSNKTSLYLLIYNLSDERIGEVSYRSYNDETKEALFNIKIEYKHRGCGYSKEAIRLMLDHYFNTFGGEVMCDNIALENPGGQQALLNFGFTHDSSEKDVYKVYITKKIFNSLYM